MKNLKILGLAVVISAALMALAGSAAATTLTSPTGTVSTPTVHWVNEGGHLTFQNPIVIIECNSTFEGNVTSHGSGLTGKFSLTNFSLTSCTNSWHITTVSSGTLEIHWTGGYNGTVTWTGAKVDATRLGVRCVYETNNTSIGTLTGGSPATLKIEATVIMNKAESSALCGGNMKWEGSYSTTSALYVAP